MRASAAVWHSDSVAMTWLPVHAVADRRYAWLRATSTRAKSRLRIQIFNGDRCGGCHKLISEDGKNIEINLGRNSRFISRYSDMHATLPLKTRILEMAYSILRTADPAHTHTHAHTTYESLLAATIMSSSNLIPERNELNVKDQVRVGRDHPEVLVAIPELWWDLDNYLLANLHASHYSFPACNNGLLA